MATRKRPNEPLDLNEYICGRTVGTGSFGRVRLIKHKTSGRHFALKCMIKSEIVRLKQVDHIYSEVKILSALSHPLLVGMEGLAQDSTYIYIMLEFVPGGELFTYLRTATSLPDQHAAFYAAQVVLMFEHLHSLDIVYRDLKPENVLIDAQGFLKLTDFGFAKKVEGRTYTLCGTPEYLAPEILMQKGHGKPVDWWCLGVLAYEMLVGVDPFSDDNPMTVYQNILRGKLRFPADVSKDAKSLIKHLLTADLDKRYGNLSNGVADIKNHRWFAAVDWNGVLSKSVAVPYTPTVRGDGDTSNFWDYPEDVVEHPALDPEQDPFLDW